MPAREKVEDFFARFGRWEPSSLVAARKLGILPIAFQSDREFVASPMQPVREEQEEKPADEDAKE